MLEWIKKLFKRSVHNNEIRVVVEICGSVVIRYDDRSGHSIGTLQGSVNTTTSAEDVKGCVRNDQRIEENIGPEFFANLNTPQVNFGTEVKLPTKKTAN